MEKRYINAVHIPSIDVCDSGAGRATLAPGWNPGRVFWQGAKHYPRSEGKAGLPGPLAPSRLKLAFH